MYERTIVLLLTTFSGILHAYWTVWALLLMTVKDESIRAATLERENERLRLLFVESMLRGSLLLQWLDCRAMAIWYSVNRPFGPMAYESCEDLISRLGRFDHLREPRVSWSLAAGPSTALRPR
jgi:hypothetical protein